MNTNKIAAPVKKGDIITKTNGKRYVVVADNRIRRYMDITGVARHSVPGDASFRVASKKNARKLHRREKKLADTLGITA